MRERKRTMIWFRIYNEIIRLYCLYNRRGFREFADLLKKAFPIYEHTIVECFGETFRVISSNIPDRDEIQFLTKTLSKEEELVINHQFQLSEMRTGIHNHLVFSLEIEENQKLGYWIVESRHVRKIIGRRKMKQYVRLLSLLLQAQKDKETALHNLEIDEHSRLPCNTAFMKQIQILQKQDAVYKICILRIDNYRTRLQNEGSHNIQKQMKEIATKLASVKNGKTFCLSEDTLAFVSWQDEKELFAQLSAFAEENELWQSVRIALVSSLKFQSDDVQKSIEIIMSACEIGMIWRHGKDGFNSLNLKEGSDSV